MRIIERRRMVFGIPEPKRQLYQDAGFEVGDTKDIETFIRAHPVCKGLKKFIKGGWRFECGRISIAIGGVEVAGDYAYWDKDWVVNVDAPYAGCAGRHLMYMIPGTYWDEDWNVYDRLEEGLIEVYRRYHPNEKVVHRSFCNLLKMRSIWLTRL